MRKTAAGKARGRVPKGQGHGEQKALREPPEDQQGLTSQLLKPPSVDPHSPRLQTVPVDFSF